MLQLKKDLSVGHQAFTELWLELRNCSKHLIETYSSSLTALCTHTTVISVDRDVRNLPRKHRREGHHTQ